MEEGIEEPQLNPHLTKLMITHTKLLCHQNLTPKALRLSNPKICQKQPFVKRKHIFLIL